jgi:hypothetical protein
MLAVAAGWDASIWVGEYGWWDDPAERPELVERVEAFAAREDGGPDAAFVPAGSAWWQWSTGCGDPHQVTDAGGEPPAEVRQYRVTRCVDGAAEDAGVVPEWRRILGRPVVRFAPGWLTAVDWDAGAGAGALDVRATGAEAGAEVELWAPGEDEPTVGGTGIASAEASRWAGGWRVTAEVTAPDWTVTVDPGAAPDAGA